MLSVSFLLKLGQSAEEAVRLVVIRGEAVGLVPLLRSLSTTNLPARFSASWNSQFDSRLGAISSPRLNKRNVKRVQELIRKQLSRLQVN